MDPLPGNAALLVVDVQYGHDDPRFGRRNNPDAEDRIAELISAWRATGRPIFHVQHLSLNPGSVFHESNHGSVIKDVVQPLEKETLIQKHTNSAFIGTDLEEMLHSRGIDTVVVTGLTTPHCVSSTARMSGNLGFNTYVVADATAANDGTTDFGFPGAPKLQVGPDVVHAISLATINGEFARVVDTSAVLGALKLLDTPARSP
jgi:nicotinamidase-related amidase